MVWVWVWVWVPKDVPRKLLVSQVTDNCLSSWGSDVLNVGFWGKEEAGSLD